MENFGDKITRFIDGLNEKSFSEKYDDVVNLIDSVIEGDYDFYLSSFEEYTPDFDEYLLKDLKYDDYTKKCIYRFISEFQHYFPNILSNEEIVNRISNNLSSSIVMEDLSLEGIEDNASITGYYNPNTKKIFIDNNLTSSITDSVLFHEFLHCITIKDTNDQDLESEFLTEAVSIMQDKFEKEKYHSKERCNNYITNYIKQLEIVCGEQFYKEYILNYRDISNCFKCYPVDKYSSKTILHNYILLFNTINNIIKNGGDEYLLKYANTIFEFNVALFLYSYLKNNELSTREKLRRIDKLVNIQKNPDIDLFKYLIDEFGKDEEVLNEYPNLLYIKDGIKKGKIDVLLQDKIDNFEAAKKCGFTEIKDYEDNPMFVKNNIFFSYPSSYYNEYLKEEDYYKVMYKIEKDMDLNINYYDLDEVYREYQNSSSSLRDEIKYGHDYTNEKLANYKKRNSSKYKFLFKAKLSDTDLFVENDEELKIYTKKSLMSLFDSKEYDDDTANLYVNLIKEGVDFIYTSKDSDKIIAEKSGKVYIYEYKHNKKYFDYVYYDLIDTQHRKENCIKKKK